MRDFHDRRPQPDTTSYVGGHLSASQKGAEKWIKAVLSPGAGESDHKAK